MKKRLLGWLFAGTSSQRFAKQFAVTLPTLMLAWVLAFYGSRTMGWKFFTGVPFSSEKFWIDCICWSFGSAVATHFAKTTQQESRSS